MKNIVRRLKIRASASQKKSRSVDPIKAYKAGIEVRIYTWLLDLIIEELEAEQEAQTVTSVTSVPPATAGTTGGSGCAPIGIIA